MVLQPQFTFNFPKTLEVEIFKCKWSHACNLVLEVALKPQPKNEHLTSRLQHRYNSRVEGARTNTPPQTNTLQSCTNKYILITKMFTTRTSCPPLPVLGHNNRIFSLQFFLNFGREHTHVYILWPYTWPLFFPAHE